MNNLYNNIEMIDTLNLGIIFSIPFICVVLYRLSKDLSYLSICIIYLVEILLNVFTIKYNYIDLYSSNKLYLLGFVYITKPILFMVFAKNIGLSSKLNLAIVIGGILQIISIPVGQVCSILFNILINIIVINYGVVNKITSYKNELHTNNRKLKLNRKYISKATQQITLEYELQNQYKNDINRLNEKVSKSIEEVDTPVFVLNKERKYIYSNNCFEEMLKLDGINLSNLDINEYIKKKFINSDDFFKKIKCTSSTNNNIANLKTYDEKIFRCICLTDIIDGNAIILCILNDITQSTLIQNKLRESEERYRKLMDILTDGVIIHDINTISYINNRAIELFSLDSNLKKVWLIDDINNKLNKKYRQDLLKNINLVQSGRKDRANIKIETYDGKIIELVTTSIKLNDKQMMISLAIDITTLEQAMIELEQSEKTYKLLLQTLPEGIVMIDKKTRNYTYRNKAMIKLLKNMGVDNFNKIVNDFINKKQYGKFKKISVDGIEKSDISVAIIDMIEDGNYLVVVRNLENAQKIEKIAEKLSEIKAKYKFKTEFLSTVTKDIKKPINIISSTNNILELNKEKYNSENICNYTRLVRQNCNRLIRILSNIEVIEDIDHGKYNIKHDKVNIIKLMKNIVHLSKTYVDEKGLEIKFISSVDEKTLFVDKNMIEKVFLNILANAIKFTSTGGVIEVKIDVLDEEVQISIKDSGVGIPQDKIGVIFEDFEQVDRTLSRGAEGTGIGLSLAKKLVDLHNGKIIVSSEIGVGSNFKVILKDNENDTKYQNITFYDDFIDKEKIDIEFSDIYLDLN